MHVPTNLKLKAEIFEGPQALDGMFQHNPEDKRPIKRLILHLTDALVWLGN